jgi:hypothetical protein
MKAKTKFTFVIILLAIALFSSCASMTTTKMTHFSKNNQPEFIVKIEGLSSDGKFNSVYKGTGFIVSWEENGPKIVTANHCINGSVDGCIYTLRITLPSGKSYIVKPENYKMDTYPKLDIAILHVSVEDDPIAEINFPRLSSKDPNFGNNFFFGSKKATAYGFKQGKLVSVEVTIAQDLQRSVLADYFIWSLLEEDESQKLEMIKNGYLIFISDSKFGPLNGMSGGPIICDGEIIGMLNFGGMQVGNNKKMISCYVAAPGPLISMLLK